MEKKYILKQGWSREPFINKNHLKILKSVWIFDVMLYFNKSTSDQKKFLF